MDCDMNKVKVRDFLMDSGTNKVKVKDEISDGLCYELHVGQGEIDS